MNGTVPFGITYTNSMDVPFGYTYCRLLKTNKFTNDEIIELSSGNMIENDRNKQNL